jgi:hypothetical protein
MPEVPAETIKTGLRVKDIATLFTVATFERMVLERMNAVVSTMTGASTVNASAASI